MNWSAEAQVAAYVLIGAAEGLLTRAMLERPHGLEDVELARQLTRPVLAYLERGAEAGRRAGARR